MIYFIKSLAAIFLFASTLTYSKPSHEMEILIPGGEGGGWDSTARQVGKLLRSKQLVNKVTYNNYSGAGGARALEWLLKDTVGTQNTLMIQSTPLIIRNLTGVLKQSYRDIDPLVTLIAEHQVIAVAKDSPYKNMQQLLTAIIEDPASNPILGGSAKNSLDHITAALIVSAASTNKLHFRYGASNGGGDALKRLYDGLGVALVTGFGEVIEHHKKGRLRILGITSEKRLPGFDIPTFKEHGYDVVFANWRGFFVNRDMSPKNKRIYTEMLTSLHQSPEWEKVRIKYGWDSFFLSGEDLSIFLEKQEAYLKEILENLIM